jgi:hypothetical protein
MKHRNLLQRNWARFLLIALVLGSSWSFDSVEARPYWFETYERAVDLIAEGKVEEAAPLLEQLIEDHPFPRHEVRVRGSHFMNYFPYFQRARIESARGDYEAAAHSLKVCKTFGEIDLHRRTLAEFNQLQKEIEAQARVAQNMPVATAAVP